VSETNLWAWLRPYCPLGRYTRVENPDAGPGSPDVNYRILKAEGWIELKDARAKNPLIPFPDEKRGLHRTQINWIRDQVTFNGIVWIAARVGNEILWIPGKNASGFNGATLKRLKSMSTLIIDQTVPAKTVRRIKELLENGK
jgi:hypothetical protein